MKDPYDYPIDTWCVTLQQQWRTPVGTFFWGTLRREFESTPVLILPKSMEEGLYNGKAPIIFVNDDLLKTATTIEYIDMGERKML